MSDLSVTVTNPIKCQDKYGQAYICYKVNSNSSRTGFAFGSHTVDRRYSDFTWLSTELSYMYPGTIVPPLPEKQTVGRFSSEFVESRRRSLERFLERVLSHPELGYSTLLAAFLQADEERFNRVKEDTKASKPKLASTAMAWFEGTMTTLANGKVPELEKSAADLKIEEITAYVTQLEKQMTNATKHADALVKSNKETAKALFDFGQGISFLGQAEGESIGAGLSQLGSTIESLSNHTSTFAENEAIKFLEPFEEYSRMLVSIKTALSQRSEKKSAYLSAIADYEAKAAAHKKVATTPGKESQVAAKEQSANSAKSIMEKSKEDFEKVSDRLLSEFDTFKAQKANDVKEILVNFVQLQLDYNRKMEEGWSEVLPKLQSVSIPVASYENHSALSRAPSIPHGAPPALPPINSGYQNHPNHHSGYGTSNPFLEEHHEEDSAGV